MNGISPTQKRYFDAIAAHIERHGSSPSFEEISLACGGVSLSTVFKHVNELEDRGLIRRALDSKLSKRKRSISIVEDIDANRLSWLLSHGYVIIAGKTVLSRSQIDEVRETFERKD